MELSVMKEKLEELRGIKEQAEGNVQDLVSCFYDQVEDDGTLIDDLQTALEKARSARNEYFDLEERLGELEQEHLMELAKPAMYWVAQVYNDLRSGCRGNYEGFTNRTGRKLTYKEDMEAVFGVQMVAEVGNEELTMSELAVRCNLWFDMLGTWSWENDPRLTATLEDVMFWCGEISQSTKFVREMFERLGVGSGDDLDPLIDFIGADFVGTIIRS